MAITASQVKELRERTGISIMKCKEALKACDGDLDQAVDHLRKQGLAAADKKAGRETEAGCCAVATDGGRGVAVLVACETDFVGGNKEFRDFVDSLAKSAIDAGAGPVEELQAATVGDGTAVGDAITAAIQKLGENIRLAEVVALTAEQVVGYQHTTTGKVATLVAGKGDAEALRNVALHAAAASPAPVALRREDVDQAVLDKEREILAQSEEILAKPEQIRPKIVEGKLGRFYKERVLLEQEMLVDGDGKMSVGDYCKAKGIEVEGYARLDV